MMKEIMGIIDCLCQALQKTILGYTECYVIGLFY